MKYRVVKDNGVWGCPDCCLPHGSDCDEFIKENNLPNCTTEDCHFEEIEDTITTKDLQDIDEANDEKDI